MVSSKRVNATISDDTYNKLFELAKIKNISASQYIHNSIMNQIKADELLLAKPEIEEQINLLGALMQDLQSKLNAINE